MWPFKRRKPPELIEPLPCNHKWRDFPAYMTYSYSCQELTVKIYEPYVCVYCKERRDELLNMIKRYGVKREDIYTILNGIEKKYAAIIKPRPIVEDMVKDEQLVDRQHLEIHDMLHARGDSVCRNEIS